MVFVILMIGQTLTFESMFKEFEKLNSSWLINLTESYKKERSDNLLYAMWFRYPEECTKNRKKFSGRGEIGKHMGLKIPRLKSLAGSNPAVRTNKGEKNG